MSNNLTCTQVGALLSFYIDGKLSEQLTQFVDAHLKACPNCQAKLSALKNMLLNLRSIHARLEEAPDKEENTDEVLNDALIFNLSAYIDNELSDEENIKVKKNIISNCNARTELENMYKVKKALYNSFEKSKNECKEDYSKLILRRIDMREEINNSDPFGRIFAFFVVIFAVFTITAVLVFGV